MLNIPSILIIFAISSGQLIKIPLGTQAGVTFLDLSLIVLSIYGIFRVRFAIKNIPSWIKYAFLFITIALLSLVVTPLKLTAFEYFMSFSYIFRFFLYIFFGMLLLWGAYPEIKNKVYKIIIYSGIILAVLGILQLAILPDLSALSTTGWDPHYFRAVSTFLDPNFFGAFMSLTLIVFVQTFKEYKWKNIFFVLLFLALLTTFSRGAYLGFLISFLALSIINKSFRFFLLTIALTSILGISFMMYQNFITIPRNIDRTQSAQYRLNSYQQGINIFQNHPILGVGFNAYRFALKEFKLGNEQFLQSRGSSTNDSSLLYVAATTGLIGVTTYLLFLGSLAWMGWRKKPALLSGLAGLGAQSFFANTLFYPFLLLWLILIVTNKDHF